MGKVISGKLAMLYIMEYLLQQSDEDHKVTMAQIKDMLRKKGIEAERRAIYDSIETLREWGFDIMYSRQETEGYYVAKREFELPELKLLVDAVQSSKFITQRKSRILIEKLKKLTSVAGAKQLQREVQIVNRVKSVNESIYRNVDKIHEAMIQNNSISFKYMKWNTNKRLVVRNGGRALNISPWALTWDNEYYYMLGYDESADILKHYRVDKMRDIASTHEPRRGSATYEGFDMAKFTNKTFSMFGGTDEMVMLKCEDSMIGPILDRFGTDVIIVPSDENHFIVNHEVTVSGQFFGWLVGLGPKVRIMAPEHVAEEYCRLLKEIQTAQMQDE